MWTYYILSWKLEPGLAFQQGQKSGAARDDLAWRRKPGRSNQAENINWNCRVCPATAGVLYDWGRSRTRPSRNFLPCAWLLNLEISWWAPGNVKLLPPPRQSRGSPHLLREDCEDSAYSGQASSGKEKCGSKRKDRSVKAARNAVISPISASDKTTGRPWRRIASGRVLALPS